jgi:hypothetical protein
MRPLHEQITPPLLAAGATIAGAGLAVELAHARSDAPVVESLVALLSLSDEANVPTWYASALLLGCALLRRAIAIDVRARRGPHRIHWLVLAAGFYYMSLDEAVELHEHLGGLFGGEGLLYFDWVIPASVVVALVALLYLPFLRALPAPRRTRFIVAGVIYVGGAVGFELPLGWWTAHAGPDNLTYALIDWAEETLELLGASLFLLALAERWHDRDRAVP